MPQLYQGGNRLIDALPLGERSSLLQSGRVVQLDVGAVTHEPGGRANAIVFPVDAILSVVARLSDGGTCEIGIIGNEGAAGIEAAFGAPTLRTTVCQLAGHALSLPTADFIRAIRENDRLDILVRATERARMFFLEQMTVCNTLHSIDQRFARWLLMVADRASIDVYPFTHQNVADVLRVRRASVTVVASEFERAGAIEYRRGKVRIVDRVQLEMLSCECYHATTQTFNDSLTAWHSNISHVRPQKSQEQRSSQLE